MGQQNKLLLKIGTQTLIEKVVETVLKSKIEEVIVVLGHEAIKIQRILRGKEVKMIKNPLYQLGMTTSIQMGIQAASKESKAYMIVLGDLVHLEVTELNLLMETFYTLIEEKDIQTVENNKEQQEVENLPVEEKVIIEVKSDDSPKLPPSPIVIPIFEGKQGNPVIFSHHFREAILQHSNMDGCKSIVEAHPDCVIKIDMPNNHILKDVDTPEDYSDLIGNT
ncbi:MAG: nucleotidyltransferase family protein [Chitinophagales bacterium]